MSAARLAARAVMVSALGFTLVPVLGANPAYACSCIQSNEQENLERADVVFKGTMDDVEATNDQFGERVFVFTPSKTYKGKTSKPQYVSTAGNSAACGVDLTGGGPFLVFANKSDDADSKADLSTSLCSGTREIKAGEEPDFKVNQATKVDEGPSEPTPPVSAEEPKGRTSQGSTGGGSDPVAPPCCKPMVDPQGDSVDGPSAPDANPNEPRTDEAPIGAPMPAEDMPLMLQTTAVATDSAAAAESAQAAGASDDASSWLPLLGALAAVGAAAGGTGWAVRRRRTN